MVAGVHAARMSTKFRDSCKQALGQMRKEGGRAAHAQKMPVPVSYSALHVFPGDEQQVITAMPY